MNNLVLTMVNGEVTTTTLQVAEVFGTRHVEVLDAIRKILAVENSTAKLFTESTYKNRGKHYPMYTMNRDGWSLLVMGFTGNTALAWKLRYIAAFNAMEEELRQPLALPKTFSEALRLLATSIEDNEKLTATIAIQAPKAEYFDDLVSHGLSLSFRDTAKELGIPERKFIASLEDRGFVFRNNSAKLMPYAKYVPRYFELKEYTKGKNTGTQTLITVGGREMLRKAMVNVG